MMNKYKQQHFLHTQLVFCTLYPDPISLVRDHRAKEVLSAHGVSVRSCNADLLYEPWEVNDDQGHPFDTFAAFWERCLSMPYDPESPLLPPKRIISGWSSLTHLHFECDSINQFVSALLEEICCLQCS